MCVLNDRLLRQWAEFGGLIPYDPECINRMAEEPLAHYNKKPTSHYNGQRGPTPGGR